MVSMVVEGKNDLGNHAGCKKEWVNDQVNPPIIFQYHASRTGFDDRPDPPV
jgi:hypothetical protein